MFGISKAAWDAARVLKHIEIIQVTDVKKLSHLTAVLKWKPNLAFLHLFATVIMEHMKQPCTDCKSAMKSLIHRIITA